VGIRLRLGEPDLGGRQPGGIAIEVTLESPHYE
jgi:hypothetical protein